MAPETCPKVTVMVIDSIVLVVAILMIVSFTKQVEYSFNPAYYGIVGILAIAMILGIVGAAIRIGVCLLISNILQWIFMVLEIAIIILLVFFFQIPEDKPHDHSHVKDSLDVAILIVVIGYYGSLFVLMLLSTIFQCKLRSIIISRRFTSEEPFSYGRQYLVPQNGYIS